jgi:hypothetical protein
MSATTRASRRFVDIANTSRIAQRFTQKETAPVIPERWRKPLILGAFVLNFVLVGWLLNLQEWRGMADWRIWAELDPSNPYTTRADGWMPFRYSPVAGWLLHWASVVGPIGFIVGHFAVLLLLPRKLGLIVAVSFPFWMDLLWGNVFTLVFVAAWSALRGNRWGVLAYIVLTLLMPRPVQFPLLAWLLWQNPWVWVPFVALFAGHAALVLLSGLGPQWISVLLWSNAEAGMASNFGGTRFFGTAWLVVGVPLALLLFLRGRPAWAGLAFAPYLLGQYWMLALAQAVSPYSDVKHRL